MSPLEDEFLENTVQPIDECLMVSPAQKAPVIKARAWIIRDKRDKEIWYRSAGVTEYRGRRANDLTGLRWTGAGIRTLLSRHTFCTPILPYFHTSIPLLPFPSSPKNHVPCTLSSPVFGFTYLPNSGTRPVPLPRSAHVQDTSRVFRGPAPGLWDR